MDRFGSDGRTRVGRKEAGKELVIGRERGRSLGQIFRRGNLAEGQIFGKAGCRAFLLGAGEQREKGASGRVWAGDSAGEPGGDFRPAQRFFEKRLISFGTAEQDRYLVKGRI